MGAEGEVAGELREREPIFHRPESEGDLETLAADDFWEVGASGSAYTREFVLAAVRERRRAGVTDPPWHAEGFRARAVGPDTYLLTYTLTMDGRTTRRLTVWRRNGASWEILFHQGTPVAEGPA